MSDVVSALQPSELDKAAEAFIQETASEFKDTELDDAIQDSTGNVGGETVVPSADAAGKPDDQVAAETAAPGTEVVKGADAEPGYERLVAREVALLEREKVVKGWETERSQYEARLKDLESRAVPEDWHDRMVSEPEALLEQLGFDPDKMVRKIIARRLEAQGKDIPDSLKSEVHADADKIAADRRIRALEAKIQQSEREQAAKAYFDQVNSGAREYVTKGISDKLPTVAQVAKRNPDWVHGQIMEVIAQDAQRKAARDPSAPLLSYEEAAKVVDDHLANLRGIINPETANTAEVKSEAKPNPPTTGAKNGNPPPQTAPNSAAGGTKVVQTPDKPLAPWLQKPETDDEGLKAALMEYRRVEKLGTP